MRILFQKCDNALLVVVIIPYRPLVGSGDEIDNQSAPAGSQIGVVRRDPKIHTDRGVVRMNIDGGGLAQALKGPGLGQRMRTKQLRKRIAKLVGNLQEQRTRQTVFEI